MPSLIKTLDVLPKPSVDAHLWADYIELLCLFNIDGMIDRSDLLDRARDRQDLGGELEELEDEIEQTILEDDSGEDDELPAEITSAAIDDEWDSRANDWFNHLKYRSAVFGMFYPFVLTDDDNVLRRRTRISERQKLYAFLLVLSNLKHFRGHQSILTSGFEIVSWEVLKCCLPRIACTHVFSRNRFSDGRYKGLNLWGKINKLAADLKVNVKGSEAEFKPTDNADNGLDVVGWVPFYGGEVVSGLLIVFGQCACGQDWPTKQYESTYLAWVKVLDFEAPPSNMVFIPFCFRNSDGTWYRQHDILLGTILMDRPRLLYVLDRKYSVFKNHPAYEVIQRLLLERDSIF